MLLVTSMLLALVMLGMLALLALMMLLVDMHFARLFSLMVVFLLQKIVSEQSTNQSTPPFTNCNIISKDGVEEHSHAHAYSYVYDGHYA